MKKITLTMALLIAATITFAQSPIGPGQAQFNAGIGLSSWGLPVYVGLDLGISNDFTIGGEFSFRSYHERWQNYPYNHSVIGISGNLNYHLNRILHIQPTWDFYLGLNVGYYIWNSPNDYLGSYHSRLGLGGQIGGRYYFTDRFGVNLEFGGGNAFSGGKFGISIKL